MGLIVREMNDIDCVVCPYCSRMYPRKDERDKAMSIPLDCERCGSPMDTEQVKAFADLQAEAAHDPAIARMGRLLRREEL